MNNLVALPILIPALIAGACLLAARWPRWQAALAIGGAAALLVVAGMLLWIVDHRGVIAMQIAGWDAPIGITLAADRFSATLLLLTAVLGLAVAVFALGDDRAAQHRSAYYPLLHVLLMGVSGAFLTGDLFNLYVWFELLLIASFGLIALGGERAGVEGATKALALNLIGSMLFLIGTGATYGMTGTLNMADLHTRIAALYAAQPNTVTGVAFTLTVAFALKAAIFPLYFWLPASYHVPPAVTGAIFAAILTKVGVYALVRVFTLPFAGIEPVYVIVLVLTTVTMISGVLGAVAQFEVKRILAWHSVSQIGYIAVGVGLLASDAPQARMLGLAAALFFMVHHGLVKPALFLVAGLMRHITTTTQLKPLGGLLRTQPLLAALFALAALSLAGVPPLSGFWAKLAIIRAGVLAHQPVVVAVMLATGGLTLLSMLKIWNEAFWKPGPANEPAQSISMPPRTMWLPAVALVAIATCIGLFPSPLISLSERAARDVLNPSAYIAAVEFAPTAPDNKAALSHQGVPIQ